MAKIKNPLLSLGAVGRLAKDLVFTRRQKVNIVEKKPIPFDAKSPAQLIWRHMYQKAIALWHALSNEEKQEWESLARPKHMTGFAWFMSQCLKPNPGIYLPLQGGTMQGDIDMASHLILNLLDPTDAQEPATKAYVDALLTFLNLTDTPANYAGDALKGVRVNVAENALEFAAMVGGYTKGARVYHTANQSIPNDTNTILAFNSERYDTDTIHDNVTNNSRLTCKTAGKYVISIMITFFDNSVGRRAAQILLNGSVLIGYIGLKAEAYTSFEGTTIYDLAVNDYIQARAYQNSGAALNVTANPQYSPEFSMQRIG